MSLYGDRSAFCVRSVWDTSGWGSRPPNCPEEAQRVKLATELQRAQRGGALYVLDEPTTGLHPSDVDKLMTQLGGLVEAGNSVVVVEHDMSVAAASDWIIDIGPGAGDEGGTIVASGIPKEVAAVSGSRTARYLAECLGA
jgi:excinuclease ABC subunit A